MKHLFLCLSLLLVTQVGSGQNYGSIEGKVFDASSQDSLLGIDVLVYKAYTDTLIISTSTDLNGNYVIDSLAYGRYDVVFSTPGYIPFKYNGVTIDFPRVRLHGYLREYSRLIDNIVEIITIYIPLIKHDQSEQGRVYEADEIKRMPIKW